MLSRNVGQRELAVLVVGRGLFNEEPSRMSKLELLGCLRCLSASAWSKAATEAVPTACSSLSPSSPTPPSVQAPARPPRRAQTSTPQATLQGLRQFSERPPWHREELRKLLAARLLMRGRPPGWFTVVSPRAPRACHAPDRRPDPCSRPRAAGRRVGRPSPTAVDAGADRLGAAVPRARRGRQA